MRGKVLSGISYFSGAGITPAYAGKSCRMWLRSSDRGDHPRICGEKKLAEFNDENGEGSPPHMRGKGNLYCFDTDRDGITPAYAGKRAALCGCRLHSKDHPRICGEKTKKSHSTVHPVAIVPLFPSVCNRPVVSNGNPAERDAPLFLPAENTVPASPAYNLRSS